MTLTNVYIYFFVVFFPTNLCYSAGVSFSGLFFENYFQLFVMFDTSCVFKILQIGLVDYEGDSDEEEQEESNGEVHEEEDQEKPAAKRPRLT